MRRDRRIMAILGAGGGAACCAAPDPTRAHRTGPGRGDAARVGIARPSRRQRRRLGLEPLDIVIPLILVPLLVIGGLVLGIFGLGAAVVGGIFGF